MFLTGDDLMTISDTVGMSLSAAKTAIHRMKGRLRELLEGHLCRIAPTEDELQRERNRFVALFASGR
jgi:hypothetical protein